MAMKAEVLERVAERVGKKMACPKEMQRRLDDLIEEALHHLRNKRKLELVTEEAPMPEDRLPWED